MIVALWLLCLLTLVRVKSWQECLAECSLYSADCNPEDEWRKSLPASKRGVTTRARDDGIAVVCCMPLFRTLPFPLYDNTVVLHVLQQRGFMSLLEPTGEIVALCKCVLQAFYRAIANDTELLGEIAPVALRPRCYTSAQCLGVGQSLFLADVQQQMGTSVTCVPTALSSLYLESLPKLCSLFIIFSYVDNVVN